MDFLNQKSEHVLRRILDMIIADAYKLPVLQLVAFLMPRRNVDTAFSVRGLEFAFPVVPGKLLLGILAGLEVVVQIRLWEVRIQIAIDCTYKGSTY